jgi:predicted RNase H-like HicB family nuclease
MEAVKLRPPAAKARFIRVSLLNGVTKAGNRSFDSLHFCWHREAMSSEIIFEVTEAEEGGFCATALGYGITTQAETLEELRTMVRDAVNCYFDKLLTAPKIIRLHFVRDEVLAG